MRKINRLADVVDWGLCIGCGACFSACDRGGIKLVNVENAGIRPVFINADCADCQKCLEICPSYKIDARPGWAGHAPASPAELLAGPALEVWEGHAADEEIRFQGSSGGMLTALSLFMLEQQGAAFVLHSVAGTDDLWANRTTQSRSRAELLARTGSRYCPSSPCDSLKLIEQSEGPCVFIGKPCDTAAVTAYRKIRPEFDRKLALVLTFFCAGTPSSLGTKNLVRELDINPARVDEIRYRGRGWPGRFTVLYENRTKEKSLSYEESWGALAAGNRPQRCQLCPDGLGEMADISCGDAWHQRSETDAGRSLILVRTGRGREMLRQAAQAGYVKLWPSNSGDVVKAQGMARRRTEVFGRIAARKILLLPAPQFPGFHLYQAWRLNPWKQRFRSIAGSLVRLVQRGLWRRNPMANPPAPGRGGSP